MGQGLPVRVPDDEDRDVFCHCRAGELSRHPDLLRGSRIWSSRRAGPRLRAERALLGKAGGSPARRRVPGDHLRPAGLPRPPPPPHPISLRHPPPPPSPPPPPPPPPPRAARRPRP